jgi:RNA 2',3'-cyclic 3'-phosphodiesterase
MPRVFVAIEIPEAVKRDLARYVPEVRVARWVPPEQNHLTLRFIGEVSPDQLAAIKGALSGISFASFPLTLQGVGHFPPGRRLPRVLWVGIRPSGALLELQQRVEQALTALGIPPEERPFSPHLTLARLKEGAAPAAAAFEARHRELAYPPFEVTQLLLFSSVLTPQGAKHRKELTVRSPV